MHAKLRNVYLIPNHEKNGELGRDASVVRWVDFCQCKRKLLVNLRIFTFHFFFACKVCGKLLQI